MFLPISTKNLCITKNLFSANWQKHLIIYLNETLNFHLHIKEKMPKAIMEIGIIKKLNKILPSYSLVPIRCFVLARINKDFVHSFIGFMDS